MDKTYDGTTAATVTYGDDCVAGDDLTIGGGKAAFGGRNAGDGKTITAGPAAMPSGSWTDSGRRF